MFQRFNQTGTNVPPQPTIPPMPRIPSDGQLHNMRRCFTVLVDPRDDNEDAIKATVKELQNVGFWTMDVSSKEDSYKTYIIVRPIKEFRDDMG